MSEASSTEIKPLNGGRRYAFPPYSSDLHDQAAERVDPRAVARIEHDRRRDLLDDRRTGDLVAGEQALARPDRAFVPGAARRGLGFEIDAPRAGPRRSGRRLAAKIGARQFGSVDQAARGHREAD